MSVSELIVMNIIPNIKIRTYREINTINNGDFLFLILNKIIYLISSQMASCIPKDKSIVNQYDKSTRIRGHAVTAPERIRYSGILQSYHF